MKEKKEYMDFAAFAVDVARKAGAEAAEACISDTESVQINVSGRQAETVNAVREAGIGVAPTPSEIADTLLKMM